MFDIQEELKKLPEKPGVYIMKDKNDKIIYVGKAVILKNRVRQYFQSSRNHDAKTVALVEHITHFEYIVTDSELEALILECNLIKKHKPRYNILLKDDKSYPFIKVTMAEDYPRVIFSRRFEKDGSKYFGPYTNVTAVRETIDLLEKIFPIKTCEKSFNAKSRTELTKARACLYYHLNQCLAPCLGEVSRDEYRSMIRDICTFLGGGHEELIGKLEAKMKEHAENFEFEKAAQIRDKINSLKQVTEKQKVLSTTAGDQDVVAFARGETDSCIQVFFIRGGKLIGREHFILNDTVDTESGEMLSSFIKQFYTSTSFIPREVILQEDIEDIDIIESWLTEKKGTKVYIRVPRKGEKLQMVEMVSKNALIALRQFEEKIRREGTIAEESLRELTRLLGLEKTPYRIEAYDISNTGTSEKAASMVVFEKGQPAGREYRKFRIKGVSGQDDYASMQEVLFRRFRHAEREKAEEENNSENAGLSSEGKFSKLPDLIFVDGGIGHVNAAGQVLEELGINIPVRGMVKDDRHRTRGLVSGIREYDLRDNLTLLRFITAIQDEAHRFALEYNRKLRQGRHSGSQLDNIEGIGEKRRKALLKHFKSINKIRSASKEELASVKGMNTASAQKIWEYYHPEE